MKKQAKKNHYGAKASAIIFEQSISNGSFTHHITDEENRIVGGIRAGGTVPVLVMSKRTNELLHIRHIPKHSLQNTIFNIVELRSEEPLQLPKGVLQVLRCKSSATAESEWITVGYIFNNIVAFSSTLPRSINSTAILTVTDPTRARIGAARLSAIINQHATPRLDPLEPTDNSLDTNR